MLSDTERRAIQSHSGAIDQYEAGRQREEERLWEPLRARDNELRELSQSDAGPTDDPRVRRTRGLSTEESMELFANQAKVKAELEQYDAKHKPSIPGPWDTPAAILKTIGDREFHWRGRLRELAELAEIEKDEAEWRRRSEEAANDAYREILPRVLAFAPLAPSVLEIQIANDPHIGIEQIRAWCNDAMRAPFPDNRISHQNAVARFGFAGTPKEQSKYMDKMRKRYGEEALGAVKEGNAWSYDDERVTWAAKIERTSERGGRDPTTAELDDMKRKIRDGE